MEFYEKYHHYRRSFWQTHFQIYAVYGAVFVFIKVLRNVLKWSGDEIIQFLDIYQKYDVL